MRGIVAAPVAAFVVLFAALGYMHRSHSGKMTAERLEYFIQTGTVLGAPLDPEHVDCKADPQKAWDYVCTDGTEGQVWGFDVNHSAVTRSSLLSGSTDELGQ